MGNNVFTIVSFFYSVMLNISFFGKKRLKNTETTLFSYIIVTNLLNIVVALLSYFSEKYHINPFLNTALAKGVIFCFYTFSFIFHLYVIHISKNKAESSYLNRQKILMIYVLLGLPILFLPIHYYHEGNVIYSYGPCANYEYIVVTLMISYWFYLLIKNIQIIKKKKYIPIIVFILLLVFVAIIQKITPELLLLTSLETYVAFLMYYTIENPDVKMLNEVYKNKEFMEQNYEDKYNFLFEMTQNTRTPLININRVYHEIKDETDPIKIQEGVKAIDHLVHQLDFSINNILNISSFDIQKIKVVNSKYDLYNFCSSLSKVISKEVNDSVSFKEEISKDLPILYGDYMKLRQILYSLLSNSCKNTEKGSIIFRVNVIEKYDICRVIFNIIDTGRGIPIEEINEILSATGELDKEELKSLEEKELNIKVCQKVVKIMGGNLMIKSSLETGTEVILTIDQRVYHDREREILDQYENQIANYEKVLIIAQDKELIHRLKNRFRKKNIFVSNLFYGMDAVDKIKRNKNYDYIFIEDEMDMLNGFSTFQELLKVEGFKTPCIMMIKKDKEMILKEYLKDGFKDVLIIDNLDEDLERIFSNR